MARLDEAREDVIEAPVDEGPSSRLIHDSDKHDGNAPPQYSQDRPPLDVGAVNKHPTVKRMQWAYFGANMATLFRWLLNLVILGTTGMIITVAKANQRIRSLALFGLVSSAVMTLDILNLISTPAKTTSLLPRRSYLCVLVANMAIVAAQFATGLYSMILALPHKGESQVDKPTGCGRRYKEPCRSTAPTAIAYGNSVAWMAAASINGLLLLLVAARMLALSCMKLTEEEMDKMDQILAFKRNMYGGKGLCRHVWEISVNAYRTERRLQEDRELLKRRDKEMRNAGQIRVIAVE